MTLHKISSGGFGIESPFPMAQPDQIFFSSKTNSVIWVREGASLAKLRHLGYEEFDYNKGNLFVR